jgi:Chaperone of endosialidase
VERDDTKLARIAQLRSVTWKWRDEAPEQARQQPGMGVIAQDVERVFPELVTTDARSQTPSPFVSPMQRGQKVCPLAPFWG